VLVSGWETEEERAAACLRLLDEFALPREGAIDRSGLPTPAAQPRPSRDLASRPPSSFTPQQTSCSLASALAQSHEPVRPTVALQAARGPHSADERRTPPASLSSAGLSKRTTQAPLYPRSQALYPGGVGNGSHTPLYPSSGSGSPYAPDLSARSQTPVGGGGASNGSYGAHRSLESLEGQSEERLEGLIGKVRLLKDITVGIGTEVKDGTFELDSMVRSYSLPWCFKDGIAQR